MKCTYLTAYNKKTDTQSTFYGLNPDVTASEDEFSDMDGLCVGKYPVLSVRKKRKKQISKQTLSINKNNSGDNDGQINITSLYGGDGLWATGYVKETDVTPENYRGDMFKLLSRKNDNTMLKWKGCIEEVDDSHNRYEGYTSSENAVKNLKTFGFGNNVVNFPDFYCVDTDTGKFYKAENAEAKRMDYVTVANNRVWGCRYGFISDLLSTGKLAAAVPAFTPSAEGERRFQNNISVKNLDNKLGTSPCYVRITYTIAGETEVQEISVKNFLTQDGLSGIIYFNGGIEQKSEAIPAETEVEFYYLNEKTQLNEIYCSALGDINDWTVGTTKDSAWTASCGTVGKWTGACTYKNYPVFFKENYIYTVGGSNNASYRFNIINCENNGVEDGSSESVAEVDGYIFYKSVNGINSFDGSNTAYIGNPFGETEYCDGVGIGLKGKYYISVKEKDKSSYRLFIYDTKTKLWTKESLPEKITDLCLYRNEIYCVYSDNTVGIISCTDGTLATSECIEDGVRWFGKTGKIFFGNSDNSYLNRLTLRLSVENGGKFDIDIEYDSSGIKERLASVQTQTLKSITIPVCPRRCDHFNLYISGTGGFTLFSVTKTYETGSDTYA